MLVIDAHRSLSDALARSNSITARTSTGNSGMYDTCTETTTNEYARQKMRVEHSNLVLSTMHDRRNLKTWDLVQCTKYGHSQPEFERSCRIYSQIFDPWST